MRLGWAEEALRNGEVVAADAEWILGDEASKSVQLDPLQGGVSLRENAGCKPCLFAVEDPDGWWPDLCFGIVFTHGKNVYRPTPSEPGQACSSAAIRSLRSVRFSLRAGRTA